MLCSGFEVKHRAVQALGLDPRSEIEATLAVLGKRSTLHGYMNTVSTGSL